MGAERLRRATLALIHRLRGTEPVVLLVLLVLTVCTWGFIELADEVLEGSTRRFDEWMILAMREPGRPEKPIGPVWLAEMGRDVTALGGIAVLVLVTAGIAGYLWLDGKSWAASFVVVVVLSGMLLSFGLKQGFQRPRPDLVPHLSHVSTSSFPSGHAMMSAVVYLSLGTVLAAEVRRRQLRIYILSMAILLTVLVGISRVYMGVHYPTDVLAGWSAGLTWALACWLAARWLQHRHHIERPSESSRVKKPRET